MVALVLRNFSGSITADLQGVEAKTANVPPLLFSKNSQLSATFILAFPSQKGKILSSGQMALRPSGATGDARSKMIEVQIIIPTKDNDGKSFTAKTFKAFEVEMARLFNGVSQLKGEVIGRWIDDNKEYCDTSRVYMVALQSIAEGGKVLEAVEFAKQNFGQLKIYVRYLGQSEIL